MSTKMVQKYHRWPNLAEMRDVEKVHFLNTPISQVGLFGNTVEKFSQQFSAVKKQMVAIKHILLCLLITRDGPLLRLSGPAACWTGREAPTTVLTMKEGGNACPSSGC